VFFIDGDGNQEYIGELDYGTIDPEFRYYPDESSLIRGNRNASLTWEVPDGLGDDEIVVGTLKVQVDPDGYVREISEVNNERQENIVIDFPPSPPDSSDIFSSQWIKGARRGVLTWDVHG